MSGPCSVSRGLPVECLLIERAMSFELVCTRRSRRPRPASSSTAGALAPLTRPPPRMRSAAVPPHTVPPSSPRGRSGFPCWVWRPSVFAPPLQGSVSRGLVSSPRCLRPCCPERRMVHSAVWFRSSLIQSMIQRGPPKGARLASTARGWCPLLCGVCSPSFHRLRCLSGVKPLLPEVAPWSFLAPSGLFLLTTAKVTRAGPTGLIPCTTDWPIQMFS